MRARESTTPEQILDTLRNAVQKDQYGGAQVDPWGLTGYPSGAQDPDLFVSRINKQSIDGAEIASARRIARRLAPTAEVREMLAPLGDNSWLSREGVFVARNVGILTRVYDRACGKNLVNSRFVDERRLISHFVGECLTVSVLLDWSEGATRVHDPTFYYSPREVVSLLAVTPRFVEHGVYFRTILDRYKAHKVLLPEAISLVADMAIRNRVFQREFVSWHLGAYTARV